MQSKFLLPLAAAAAVSFLTACTTPLPSSADLDKLTKDLVARSFRAEGQAQLDRVNPDEDNLLCSQADQSGTTIDEKLAAAIEARNMQTIKLPADGKFLGDYKEGEKIAQSGSGKTWTDKADAANGGNCYNCHQISKEELSYCTTMERCVVLLTQLAQNPSLSWSTHGARSIIHVPTTLALACQGLATKAF
jgi:sulfur-oxidizing protein SoxX